MTCACGQPATRTDGTCDLCAARFVHLSAVNQAPMCARCPVCEGRGLVPRGFYEAVGCESWTVGDFGPETCRSCAGHGYVWVGR